MLQGLFHHLILSLRLNFRSKQALIYGYFVPLFFLFAFGTLFHGHQEMGQLLTISVLGGACFGMPTAMVAERERGVWRRYRLLPTATSGLVASTMIARFFIVGSAAIMQIFLAQWVYGTNLPAYPFQLLVAFTFVAFSFEAIGLVIAAAADNVPAVQALGQALFLPVIIIGGVGVPLSTLPGWAQRLAGFLPGRYAVEAMQACFSQYGGGLKQVGFPLFAMTVIGVAGCVAGAKLFRWDANQKFSWSTRSWVLLAVASWIAVGLAAASTDHLKVVHATTATVATAPQPWQAMSEEQINSYTFTGLAPDADPVSRLAPNATGLAAPDEEHRMQQMVHAMEEWKPAHLGDHGQAVRNLLCAAAVADVSEDPLEGNIARAVFDQLRDDFQKDELIHILAWIMANPDQGTVYTDVPELDIHGPINPDVIRMRVVIYAQKLLGRLLDKIPDIQDAGP